MPVSSETRVGLYTRVSTRDQSTDEQVASLERVARQRGWTVVRTYDDVGWSGARGDRPGLKALLADAAAGELDLVAVTALDRLARSTRHFIDVMGHLRASKVGFFSLREQFDTTGPFGSVLLTIVAAFAEFERELIRERVRAGIAEAKRKGKRVGRPRCRGAEARIVALRREGHSLRAIAKRARVTMWHVRSVLKEAAARGQEAVGP